MRSRKVVELAPVFAALALASLTMTACAPKSHEERVAGLRSYYKAKVIGFIVKAQPAPEMPAEPMDAEEGFAAAAEEAAAAEFAEGEELAAEEQEVPVKQDVAIDILLQHDSPEKLPGITLDIEMVDSNKQTKNSWRVWVETAKLPKATGTQFTHLLEDVDYVEGDGFSVEVRSPVPPEERGEYREFAAPAGN